MTDAIPKIPDALSGKSQVTEITSGTPSAGSFEQAMQNPRGMSTGAANGPAGTSPMDLARGGFTPNQTPTYDSLLAQARTVQDGLGKVHTQLNQNQAALQSQMQRQDKRQASQYLARGNKHLDKAAAKLGTGGPAFEPGQGSKTIAQLLGWVGHGQDQLMAAQEKIKQLAASPDTLNPGDMLYVQTQMNAASQQVQYATQILGAVIKDITQIMSTQL